MKAYILLLLALIAFSGCSDRPVITDNSTVVVQPGLGISNVCAVGMTYEQIRKATGDAALVEQGPWSFKRLIPWRRKDRFVFVPSLCARIPFASGRINYWITFQVTTNDWNQIPFRGRIGEKLSFKDGPVSRAQVEAALGPIKTNFTSANPFPNIYLAREPFAIERGQGLVNLFYTRLGLYITLSNNVVTEFSTMTVFPSNQ